MDYQTYWDSYQSTYPLSAIACVITKKGHWIFHSGESHHETHHLISETSLFAYGSIAKFLTAITMLSLIDQKKVGLHDPISPFFKEYPFFKGITIHHLLSHTSGISSFTLNDHPYYRDQLKSLRLQQELKNLFIREPLLFEPGTKRMYSNTGYLILGWIIEKITGTSFESYTSSHIFPALGLTNVGWGWPPHHHTAGYELNGNNIIPSEVINLKNISASGGLVGPLQGLIQWHQWMENPTLLSYDSLLLLNKKDDWGGGYGRYFSSLEGHQRIQTNGSVLGFLSQWDYYPDDHVSVIILSNYGFQNVSGLADDLAKISFNINVDLPKKAKEISLDQKELTLIEGTYGERNQKGAFSVYVFVDEGRPWMQFNQLNPFPISPIGPFTYAHTLIDEIYSFEVDKRGHVSLFGLQKNQP